VIKLKKKKFYITTPIYYVNDKPHIGHAYTTIIADILARWHRIKGEKVFFLTGTDEHGEKVEKAAKDVGKSPKEFVDEIVEQFKSTWKKLNISYDDFIRTTEERHEKVVIEVIKKIAENGDIYKGEYEGWYCTPCESFWTEIQLKNGKCPQCEREVKRLKEESYFFRLSKYQEKLLKFYEENPEFLSPSFRAAEIINRVKGGLKDISITRTTVKWAIPFPLDTKHFIYVWVDALINYISALGLESEKFNEFWPADVHLVGKEINWFHSVIWPAMLMSAGFELPKKVFAHGWWTVEGKKMSKSLGNVVNPVEIAEKYSADALRYFLVREMPLGDDGDFSEKSLIARINGELVADLGNLVYRVVTLAEKFDGKIEGEPELEKNLDLEKIDDFMEKFDLFNALNEIWKFVRAANKYINEKEVWKLKDKELANALYNLLEACRIIAILIYPFMPSTAEKINEQLGVKLGSLKDCKFKKFEGKVKKGEYLFKKVEFKVGESLENKEIAKASEIPFSDFQKMDIRVGKVVNVEIPEGSKTIYKLTVDFGDEKRVALSGLKNYYKPEELLGNKYVFILNLEKKKILGIESECMILAAEDGKGNVVLIKPEKDVDVGSKIK
jgi:methionyl-tRNA synthetase